MSRIVTSTPEVDEVIGMRYSLMEAFQGGISDLRGVYDSRSDLHKQNKTLQTSEDLLEAVLSSYDYETQAVGFLRGFSDAVHVSIRSEEASTQHRQELLNGKINTDILPKLREAVAAEYIRRSDVVKTGLGVRNFVVGEIWRSVMFGRDFTNHVVEQKIETPDDSTRHLFDEWGYVIGGSYVHSASVLQTKAGELKEELLLG